MLALARSAHNIIQESLWYLPEADLANTWTAGMDVDSDPAAADTRALARSLRTLVSVVWERLSQEASFMRLALADAAEHVGQGAQTAAKTLRQVDQEV